MSIRRLLLIFCIFIATLLRAQTETLYQFNEEELDAVNANTLADLIAYMPLVHSFKDPNDQVARVNGALDLTKCAIFMDGIPMFMDQNIEIDLHAISLQDVIRVELKLPKIESLTKGIHTFNIYLYTRKIDDQPSAFTFNSSIASDGDALVAVNSSFSNRKHSFGVGFSRYFENAITSDSIYRMHELPSFTNQKVRLDYKYVFLREASVAVRYDIRSHQMITRNALFEGTSRSTDNNEEDIIQRLGMDLSLPLSRAHTLKLIAQFTQDDHYHYTSERDLSTLRNDRLPILSLEDSTRHRHILLATSFSKRDTTKRYSYSLGIQYSYFQDRYVPSIKAIPLSYTDYVLSASADFIPNDIVLVQGGMHFLSNSLFGFKVLPRARIVLEATPKLSLVFNHSNSVLYPFYSAIFYPAEQRNAGIDNNLNLDASTLSLSQMMLRLNNGSLEFTSGILYSSEKGALRTDHELESFTSRGITNALSTFLSLAVKQKQLDLRSLFAIIGYNSSKDQVDQFFYVPELSITGAYRTKQNDFGVYMMAKVSGSAERLNTEMPETLVEEISGFHRIDIGLSKSFLEGKWKVSVGVNNLTNQYNIDHSAYLIDDFERDKVLNYTSFASRPRSVFARLTMSVE